MKKKSKKLVPFPSEHFEISVQKPPMGERVKTDACIVSSFSCQCRECEWQIGVDSLNTPLYGTPRKGAIQTTTLTYFIDDIVLLHDLDPDLLGHALLLEDNAVQRVQPSILK